MSNYLIDVFQDTQKRLWENSLLCQLTSQSVMCAQVFPERFETTRVVGSYPTGISVTDETTFQAAKRLKDYYIKVGVLNFANAVNPGGGVEYGAKAQEEDLCRCSNLYPVLMKPELFETFYSYNNYFSPYYTDRVIYTPNITVFKTEAPEYSYTDNWFQVDVLTCPAPNLNGISSPDYEMLEKIYVRRIHNILSVAEAHGIQALVLGAFGCGAFMNPPEIMAKAFLQEIMNGNYKESFREIVFAIKASSPQGIYNFQIFREVLCPWQANPIYGRRVSILGDGISTYQGYNPEGYPVFYTDKECMLTGMYSEMDTWWMKLLGNMQGNLVVNNSCEGSLVSGNDTFSGHNDNRIYKLFNNEKAPDVILVALGIEDYEKGVPIEPEDSAEINWDNYHCYFKSSYEMILWKLKQYFPLAEIYCSTISYGAFGGNTNHLFAEGIHGIPLKEYNKVICEAARDYGCHVADIAQILKCYESIDGVHPTAAGMCQLADAWECVVNNPKNKFCIKKNKKKKVKNSNNLLIVLSSILMILVVILIILVIGY